MRSLFKVVVVAGLVICAGMAFWLFSPTGNGQKTLLVPAQANNWRTVFSLPANQGLVKLDGIMRMCLQLSGKAIPTPGRYATDGNHFQLFRHLRNGRQASFKLIINKERTVNDVARLIGEQTAVDTATMAQFLTNKDSLAAFDVVPETALTLLIPDTYEVYWNTTARKLMMKWAAAHDQFWNEERKEQAAQLGLTTGQVYTLASIVEEETNVQSEKGIIARVYWNRLQSNMPLGADPTVKFAIGDFSLKRIYEKHLMVNSPYNTYRVKGLPPGPICTPSKKTIDAVLQSKPNNYLYFVAKADFSGEHDFSATYAEHLTKAKAYQQALNQAQQKNKSEDF